ncbi:MAG: VOC family protein, partial [Planctomycetes bacterium]|nr:VOC family protein [Planctomycetota bacterium]
MTTPVHHAIDYIEFAVTDMAAAQRFYGDAFGWRFTSYGDAYAGIQGLDREVGGLRLEAEVVRGGPLVVLFSLDLEASQAAVERAGGQITT